MLGENSLNERCRKRRGPDAAGHSKGNELEMDALRV